MYTSRVFRAVVAGAVLLTGFSVVHGAVTDLNTLNQLTPGINSFNADGETFDAYVDHDGVYGWLLVGRGRQGWQFDTDGQGAVASVSQNLGTSGAFSPALYRDAIVNDLIGNSGTDMTDVVVRLRRAANTTGTAYQEGRWRDFTTTNFTADFDAGSGQPVAWEILAGDPLGAGPFTQANSNTRDNCCAGSNGPHRVFTWDWDGHGYQQGFSYGSSVEGTNGNSPTTFMWENTSERHAIPYTEVYIRRESPSPITLTNLKTLNLLNSGAHSFTADGQTFDGYVDHDGTHGWLLVGRGRDGWEFDTDGQGTVSDVIEGLGTSAAFSPALYSDALINDLISNSDIDLTNVEIRLRRATSTTGTSPYQEVRWRPISQTTWTGEFDAGSGYSIESQVRASILNAAYSSVTNTRDNLTNPPNYNDARRVFTWAWGGHGNQKGFSYGAAVTNGANNATSFLWENGNENHAIPYTEVYIRSLFAVVPEPSTLLIWSLLAALGIGVGWRRNR